MKKNVMMRIASILVVAVLLTTCVISGTFAKYVTKGEAEDSARVAKFGVTVTGTGDMFNTEYENHDKIGEAEISETVSVKNGGADSMRLVAPGTNGSLGGYTITGTPEVAVRVSYTLDKLDLTGWADKNGGEYFPIIFTINNETYGVSGIMDSTNHGAAHPYADVTSLKAGLKAAIEAYSKDYPVNQNLSTITADDIDIAWEWAFDYNDDVKDTYLGDQAALGNYSEIEIAITCKVTQID